jgi:hypothetical protein
LRAWTPALVGYKGIGHRSANLVLLIMLLLRLVVLDLRKYIQFTIQRYVISHILATIYVSGEDLASKPFEDPSPRFTGTTLDNHRRFGPKASLRLLAI